MAHKSKTQRAKASTAKANRKDRIERDEELAKQVAEEAEARANGTEIPKSDPKPVAVERPKKQRFKFLKEVRAEMKRVTWPTRQDVVRWSGVVVGALLFFGVYVAVLDNLIVTPALLALSSLG